MHSRKEFYTQAIVLTVIGAFSVCLMITIFALFHIEVSNLWSRSYAPWMEEGVKYLFVLILMSVISLNIKAIPFIGVGFAVAEAVRRYELTGYASPRAFLAHLTFGLVMAFFVYLAHKTQSSKFRGVWLALALLIPVALHLLYNIYLG